MQPHMQPRRAQALWLCALLMAAHMLGGCGWLDPEAEEDPFDAVRNVCPHFASILYEYGSTLAGPYSRLAFSDFSFTRADDSGGYTVLGSARRDDALGCGGELAGRLARVCNSAACSRYSGGDPTLEGCLLEIEAAFYQPTYACHLCGDGYCEQGPENASNCPQDCRCGDGTCQRTHGENLLTCGQDCPNACGDGVCVRPFEECTCAGVSVDGVACSECALDCCNQVCGDTTCTGTETPDNCEQDCGTGTCGDTHCRGLENILNCPADCADIPLTCITDPLKIPSGTCGDGLCSGCEVWTCARDCANADFGVCADPANPVGCPAAFCGDGACSGAEDAINCPADCFWPGSVCGNARCEREDYYAGCAEECAGYPFCGDGLCLPGEPMVWFFRRLACG